MATAAPRKLFVNLPVRDLEKSMDFFAALGFTFNPQVHGRERGVHGVQRRRLRDAAAGAVLQDVHPIARSSTRASRPRASSRSPAPAARRWTTWLKKALAAGGTPAMPSQDHGFMFSSSFHDLDGHHWEVLWMDPSFVQK